MKYVIIILFFTACIHRAKPIKTDVLVANTEYYLYALQVNEDSTYRITLYLNEEDIQVIISVPSSDIEFRKNDTINSVYKEIVNGSYTGKYIIRLKSDFKITNYNL